MSANLEKAMDALENAWLATVSSNPGEEKKHATYHNARESLRVMYRARCSKLAVHAWLGMWRPSLDQHAVDELLALIEPEAD